MTSGSNAAPSSEEKLQGSDASLTQAGTPRDSQTLRQQLSSQKSPCTQCKQNPKENKANFTF